MEIHLTALARDPRFIPMVYNYCDMRCTHCPVTSRCLVYAIEPARTRSGDDLLTRRACEGLALARAVAETSGPSHKAAAELDLVLSDPSKAPLTPVLGHPLEFLARHYVLQTLRYLSLESPAHSEDLTTDSPLGQVCWYHRMVAAKTYRALVFQHRAVESPELVPHVMSSAKMALIAIDRSITAWRSVAAGDDDARIAAVIELLEALRTGVEIRFPDARTFVRPGLDDPLNARAIESGGSGDECAGGSRAGAPHPPPPAPRLADV